MQQLATKATTTGKVTLVPPVRQSFVIPGAEAEINKQEGQLTRALEQSYSKELF